MIKIDKPLRMKDVMKMTGLSRRKIMDGIESNKLKAFKNGKLWLFTEENLQKWTTGKSNDEYCVYCMDNEPLYSESQNGKADDIAITENIIVVDLHNEYIELRINYCPMCRRRLKKGEK